MRKGQGDGDWEPTALELSGKLGRANRKIKALQAQVKKLEEQQKLSQEPPPPRPPTPPPRSPGPLWCNISGFHSSWTPQVRSALGVELR